MRYADAAEVLRAAGLPAERRSFGIEIEVAAPAGAFRLQIGRASAGGDELSVAPPVGHVRWFRRATLDELVALIVEAQRRVVEARSPTILEALLELDPR